MTKDGGRGTRRSKRRRMEEVSAGGQTGKEGEAHDHSTVDEGSIPQLSTCVQRIGSVLHFASRRVYARLLSSVEVDSCRAPGPHLRCSVLLVVLCSVLLVVHYAALPSDAVSKAMRCKAVSLHWPRAFHCVALLRNQLYECVFLGTSSLFNPLSSYFVNSC